MTMKRIAASVVGALIVSLVACAYAPAVPDSVVRHAHCPVTIVRH
jgi:hypothetical protein